MFRISTIVIILLLCFACEESEVKKTEPIPQIIIEKPVLPKGEFLIDQIKFSLPKDFEQVFNMNEVKGMFKNSKLTEDFLNVVLYRPMAGAINGNAFSFLRIKTLEDFDFINLRTRGTYTVMKESMLEDFDKAIQASIKKSNPNPNITAKLIDKKFDHKNGKNFLKVTYQIAQEGVVRYSISNYFISTSEKTISFIVTNFGEESRDLEEYVLKMQM